MRFCGFSPGFAYLDGLDPRLHVAAPRLAAHRRPGRFGRDRRRVHRRVSALVARRLAAAGTHRRASCGTSPATRRRCSRPAPACGSCRHDRDRRGRTARDGPGSRPARLGRAGRAPFGRLRPRRGPAGQPAGRQPRRQRRHRGHLWRSRGAGAGSRDPGTDRRRVPGRRLRRRVQPSPAGRTLRLGVPAAGLRSYLGVRGGIARRPGARLAQHRPAQRARAGAAARGRPAAGRARAGGRAERRDRSDRRAHRAPLRISLAPRADWFAARRGRRADEYGVDGAAGLRPDRRAPRRPVPAARPRRRAAERADRCPARCRCPPTAGRSCSGPTRR